MIKSIAEVVTSETIINKSRFICALYPCDTLSKVEKLLENHKILYPNATHHCYAYCIRSYEKANDDGEPSGTAGLPILNVLQKNEVQSVLAVVTRYYGGIKLGAGGLIRAYSQSCAQAMREASIVIKQEVPLYELSFDYSFIGQIDYFLKTRNITVLDKAFEQKVKYQCFIQDASIFSKIQDITSNQYTKKMIRKEYIEIPEVQND